MAVVRTRQRQTRGTPIVKSARNKLDILSAYRELGSYRAAAALCGTTHQTVCRVVERHGRPPIERPAMALHDAAHRLVGRPAEGRGGPIAAQLAVRGQDVQLVPR